MKKYIFIYFIGINSVAYGQTFLPMPPGFNNSVRTLCYDSTTNYLYAGGNFSALADGTPMQNISRWNGTYWDSLGSGVNDQGQIRTMVMYDGELIVGGTFNTIGGIFTPGLAKWNGNSWMPFANVLSASGFGCVLGLSVYNNVLFVNGCYSSLNGSPLDIFASYDGTTWASYPSLFSNNYGTTSTSAVFNNELFVGGNFFDGVGKEDIARFDGTNWQSVGGGIQSGISGINRLKIYQNKLYAGGLMNLSAGDPGNHIAAWDGNSWDILNNGLSPSGGNVSDMIVFNNHLYVCGLFFDAGGIPVTHVAKWDGNTWSDIGGIFNNGAGAFATNGTELYIGGGFLTVNGDTNRSITRYIPAVGLNEAESSNLFQILPNPFSFSFQLIFNIETTTSSQFQILNSQGAIIYDCIVPAKSYSFEVKLDEKIKSGFYIGRLFSENNISSIKLLIQ